MVWKWFRWLSGASGTPNPERVLKLESELHAMRLEAAERDRSLSRAEVDLAREHARDHGQEAARADVSRLLDAISTPVVQLVTLAHLREGDGSAARADDVLDVAMRLVSGLQDCGLQLSGAVGEIEPFDPGRHEPLSTTTALEPGQRAVVRSVGLAYHDRTLRKAGVEAAV